MSATRTDPVLSKVLRYARCGWPEKVNWWVAAILEEKRWNSGGRRLCAVGHKIDCTRQAPWPVLKELRRAHSGIVQMKVLTHSHVWWPGLDEQVEKCAKACIACQVNQNSPLKAPLHPWAWPTTPWQRLHVDYAGPINSMMILIIVDVHSKWPEVYMVNSMTARTTIARLREGFACFGLPEQLASDNGPQFTFEEFETLLWQNGVKHLCSSPYHPVSNGAAEWFVQVVKWAVRIGLWEGYSMDHALTNFFVTVLSLLMLPPESLQAPYHMDKLYRLV